MGAGPLGRIPFDKTQGPWRFGGAWALWEVSEYCVLLDGLQGHSIKHKVPEALDSQMCANPDFYRSGWRRSPEYYHKALVFVEVAGTLGAQMAVR